MDERDRCILLSVINELKTYLSNNGWTIISAPSPQLSEVYITEGYQDTKVIGNCIGVSYYDITPPQLVELGNPRLKKITRSISFSIVSPNEVVGSNLVANVKYFLDSLDKMEFKDSQGQPVGMIFFENTVARKLFPQEKENWQKSWWSITIDTIDYYEL